MTLRLPGNSVTRHTEYLVGIDAGGTKTQIRAELSDGTAVVDHVAPSGMWTSLGFADKATALAEQLRSLGLDHPAAVAVGAHGCDSDLECHALQDALEKHIAAPVTVVNDAFLLLPADQTTPTAGLVIGTGSIAVARDSFGRSLYAGGWGWLVGDSGSAWGIVREAVRSLTGLADHSGDQLDDPLFPALLNVAGATDLRQVIDVLQNKPAHDWAAWAPTVFAALQAGSTAAEEAVDKGVATLIGHVKNLTHRGAQVEKVIAGGAVILGQPEFERRLRQCLRSSLGIRLDVYRESPVLGAVNLARTMTPTTADPH